MPFFIPRVNKRLLGMLVGKSPTSCRIMERGGAYSYTMTSVCSSPRGPASSPLCFLWQRRWGAERGRTPVHLFATPIRDFCSCPHQRFLPPIRLLLLPPIKDSCSPYQRLLPLRDFCSCPLSEIPAPAPHHRLLPLRDSCSCPPIKDSWLCPSRCGICGLFSSSTGSWSL